MLNGEQFFNKTDVQIFPQECSFTLRMIRVLCMSKSSGTFIKIFMIMIQELTWIKKEHHDISY